MGTRHLVIVYYKGKYWIAQYGQWDGYPDGQGRDVLEFARDPEMIAKLAAALDADMLYEPTEEQGAVFDKKIEEMEKALLEKQRELSASDEALLCLRTPEAIMRLSIIVDATLESSPTSEELAGFKRVIASIGKALEKVQLNGGNAIYASTEQRPIHIVCPSLSRDFGARILPLVADATEKIPVVSSLDFITDGLFCEWSWLIDLDARVLECWRGGSKGHEESTRFDHLESIKSGEGQRPGLRASFPLADLPDEPTFLKACEDPKEPTEPKEPEEPEEPEKAEA